MGRGPLLDSTTVDRAALITAHRQMHATAAIEGLLSSAPKQTFRMGTFDLTSSTANANATTKQQILAEIERLRSELAGRQALDRPAPGSVMHAYRTLIERQYDRLDRLDFE